MARKYKQMSLEERSLVQAQLSMRWSLAAIAARLQRARSTVWREMRRNGWKPNSQVSFQSRRWGNGGYLARAAQQRADALHRKPRRERRLRPATPVWELVLAELARGLSPEQLAFTLGRMPEPVRLSHETIYTALYAMPRGELRWPNRSKR